MRLAIDGNFDILWVVRMRVVIVEMDGGFLLL